MRGPAPCPLKGLSSLPQPSPHTHGVSGRELRASWGAGEGRGPTSTGSWMHPGPDPLGAPLSFS